MKFLNRAEELAMLRKRLNAQAGELLVVYGRRRIGKTELLTQLASETRSFYFEATDTVALDQLRDFAAELGRVWANELLTSQPLTRWEAAFAALTQFVGEKRTFVVLDEFQLLAEQSPELESILSKWWRTTGRHLPLTLVLAGSELSFFEDQILAGRLYGRRTGQLKLEPFLAREAALFHMGYTPEDRVRAFSVCGGIPYYLDRFTDNIPLEEHLFNEIFERTGLLHDEAELMLRQSIADPTNHIAVLRSIAHGHNRNNDISQRTQLTPAYITKILETLERLGLIERLRPITASTKGKKTAYAISDHFLRFHYRFVEPAKSQLRTHKLARSYFQQTVLPQFDHHASLAWEDICRQYVLTNHPNVEAVGRWWGPVPTGEGKRTAEQEIDVAGMGDGALLAVGMCKWTTHQVDFDELNLLDRLLPYIEKHTGKEYRYLFSRSGFTPRLKTFAGTDPRLHLITPEQIYAKIE